MANVANSPGSVNTLNDVAALALKNRAARPITAPAAAVSGCVECPTMLQSLIWASLAVAGLAAGWFASAWVHQRRIEFLQVQLRVMRQTMAAHTDQARRQIGQLQAELAARPPAARAPEVADALLHDGIRRKPAAPDRYGVMEDGFPQTAIIGEHFPPTMMMR